MRFWTKFVLFFLLWVVRSIYIVPEAGGGGENSAGQSEGLDSVDHRRIPEPDRPDIITQRARMIRFFTRFINLMNFLQQWADDIAQGANKISVLMRWIGRLNFLPQWVRDRAIDIAHEADAVYFTARWTERMMQIMYVLCSVIYFTMTYETI